MATHKLHYGITLAISDTMRLPIALSELSAIELLQLQAAAVDVLQKRNIVRTINNPIGDYTEWLVAKAFELQLSASSQAGYDAKSKEGVRFQIKSRRLKTPNAPRQLSAIRKLEDNAFDQLIAVIYNREFHIVSAYRLPYEAVKQFATFRAHTNSHIVHLTGDILLADCVEDITERLATVHYEQMNDKEEPPESITVPRTPEHQIDYADEINKVARRLPNWAQNQDQINSRILTAFLSLKRNGLEPITPEDIALKADISTNFGNNFTQMANVGERNHGKVFEVIGGTVSIWQPVKQLVDQYEDVVFSR